MVAGIGCNAYAEAKLGRRVEWELRHPCRALRAANQRRPLA